MAMFKRADADGGPDPASPPKIGEARPIRSKNVSVIGPTLVFKGELSADEDLVIEGDIEGTIAHHKKHLTIGKQGRVKADIHASSVIVEGRYGQHLLWPYRHGRWRTIQRKNRHGRTKESKGVEGACED
jgi:hypothetical protein